MQADRPQDGFTLIEIIVAIAIVSILAAAIAPLAVQQTRAARSWATIDKMERIFLGMLGDPGSGHYGFVGDMGRLPNNLADLVDPTGQPAYVINADGIGAGWNGPYLHEMGGPAVAGNDAWGTALIYAGTAQITSLGADRQVGTADDISLPAAAPAPWQGGLTVHVRGIPNPVDSSISLTNVEVQQVRVSRTQNGVADAPPPVVPWNAGAAAFTLTPLHVGVHSIVVTGSGAAGWGTTSTVVTEVSAGTNAVTVTLVQP